MQYHLRIGKGFMPDIRRASVRDNRSPVMRVHPPRASRGCGEEHLRSKHSAMAAGMKVWSFT